MIFCRKFVLAFFAIGLTLTTYSQESSGKEYFRHFSIQVKNLDQDEFAEIQTAFSKQDYFEAIEFCTITPSVLIRVNASYPKRVNDIKTEITQIMSQQLATRRILHIESISDKNKSNFCK